MDEHPDAKLVIRSTSTSLEFELHVSDGRTLAPFEPKTLKSEPEGYFKEAFSKIEELPLQDRPSKVRREMEKWGASLSKQLLSLDLGRKLLSILGDGSEPPTLWIQSDEPWIPWELLRLPSSVEDRGFQGLFLGEAFAVARWLLADSRDYQLDPCPSLPLQNLAVVVSRESGLDAENFLGGLFDDEKVEAVPADEELICEALAANSHDAWHFISHGLTAGEPTRVEIMLESDNFSPDSLSPDSLHTGMLSRRPLVFLNVCHAGRLGFSLTGIGGWAEAFLSAGAGAFLGAYWAIEDEPAARFSEVFYTALLKEGRPIAEAVRRARLAIRHEFPGDPTWLAYTLFAHPLAVRETDKEQEPEEQEPEEQEPEEQRLEEQRLEEQRLEEPRTGIRFLWIPGERFEMGGGRSDAHWISPFLLAETPVTNQQYGMFLEASGHREPRYWRNRRFSKPDQPVVGVSWHDARAFCAWLSKVLDRAVTLPTEAQWEFAARGTDGLEYPWGSEEPDKTRARYGLPFGIGQPSPVGSFPDGPFGTLDQAGNVWEWCLDAWDEEKRGEDESLDPFVPGDDESEDVARLLRGGGWVSDAQDLRSTFRSRVRAGNRYGDVGFRVCAPKPPWLEGLDQGRNGTDAVEFASS